MATAKPIKKGALEEPEAKQHPMRLVLTGQSVKDIEAVTNRLKEEALKMKLIVKGPVRMPTKCLRITCRKTPCGEGSKTWDRFEMRIHKRLLDVIGTTKDVELMTRFSIPSGLNIEVILKSD